MIKQYDEFTKMKVKDMSKAISDMTFTYIDPETNKPTKVPAGHYEKILNQVQEQHLSEIARISLLNTMYVQLKAIRDEDPKYFRQAMVCLDMGLKPSEMRVNERIALSVTNEMLDDLSKEKKKDFHLLDSQIINYFENAKNDPEIQVSFMTDGIEQDEYDEEDEYEF